MSAPLKAVPSQETDGDTKKKSNIWAGLAWMSWHGARLASTVLFPIFVMLASWAVAPFIGLPGFAGLIEVSKIGQDPWIFAMLFACGIAMMVWYWANIRVAQNLHTTINELKSEVSVSIWMAYAVLLAAGWMLGKHGSLYWWFIVPALVQMLDGIGTAVTALNNAAQKPLIQSTRG